MLKTALKADRDILDTLQSANSQQDLEACFIGFCQQSNIDFFQYLALIPINHKESRIIPLNNFPDAFKREYFQNRYEYSDPTIAHCREHASPAVWHELDKQYAHNESAQNYIERRRSYGLRSGISFAVRDRCSSAMFSLISRQTGQRGEQRIFQAFNTFYFVAPYFHEAALRVFAVEPVEVTPLSKRENECIRLKADGLTDKEIAKSLGISPRTVADYLDNICHKIGAESRKSVLARAQMLGLLEASIDIVDDITVYQGVTGACRQAGS